MENLDWTRLKQKRPANNAPSRALKQTNLPKTGKEDWASNERPEAAGREAVYSPPRLNRNMYTKPV